ncbi:hypothetical protein C2W62_40925 [Candidatus Entotheonella serta]|nr:hypothetical protein C2W62_40925 [Candidatus Entotheonella serta]
MRRAISTVIDKSTPLKAIAQPPLAVSPLLAWFASILAMEAIGSGIKNHPEYRVIPSNPISLESRLPPVISMTISTAT